MTYIPLNSAITSPPPPRLHDETGAHARRDSRTGRKHCQLTQEPDHSDQRQDRADLEHGGSERGFTLQTLIILAIFVVLATIAGVVIVALTSSSGDSFEDAGSTDLGENCRPHEVRDQALESMGISGTHEHLDQYKSDTIGCKPYCGTWEYYSKGQNANGEYEYDPDASLGATMGGPDGAGGVYSSNIGCFAPCYWDYDLNSSTLRPTPGDIDGGESKLLYFDDNREPEVEQIRLGVNYFRATEITIEAGWFNYTDLFSGTDSEDRKPFINTRSRQSFRSNRFFAGKLPIPSQVLAGGVPKVFIPNFKSTGQDPAETSGDLTDRNGTNKLTDNDGNWADENWEWRADPINRTCTIVNVTQNDRIVCSSEWQNCASRP